MVADPLTDLEIQFEQLRGSAYHCHGEHARWRDNFISIHYHIHSAGWDTLINYENQKIVLDVVLGSSWVMYSLRDSYFNCPTGYASKI
jgi:hypothetical protein